MFFLIRSMKQKQKKTELTLPMALILCLVIVAVSAKLLLMAQISFEAEYKATAANLPELPLNFQQNQLSAIIYDGYLDY